MEQNDKSRLAQLESIVKVLGKQLTDIKDQLDKIWVEIKIIKEGGNF